MEITSEITCICKGIQKGVIAEFNINDRAHESNGSVMLMLNRRQILKLTNNSGKMVYDSDLTVQKLYMGRRGLQIK